MSALAEHEMLRRCRRCGAVAIGAAGRCARCGRPALRPLRADELHAWEALDELGLEARAHAVEVRCGLGRRRSRR